MDHAYHRPRSVDEALALKRAQPSARFLAGGTDLLVQEKKRRLPGAALISLRNIAELCGVTVDDAVIRIGGATPLVEVERHPAVQGELPALVAALATLASKQIRNVATVGGNLCNASPAADTAPPLLVYDARVELASERGTRELALEAFLRGPGKTALDDGELLCAVIVPRPARAARSAFLRKGRVAMDLALASVAALVELDDGKAARVRLAAGAVAPVPLRLANAEAALAGRALADEAVRAAAEAAARECAPIDDVRTSASYRRRLVRVLLERALRAVVDEKEASHGTA